MNVNSKSISENRGFPQLGETWDAEAGKRAASFIRKRLKLKAAEAPDFLHHHAAAVEVLVALGASPHVTVQGDGFVCTVVAKERRFATAPQASAPAAATAALFELLQNQSALT